MKKVETEKFLIGDFIESRHGTIDASMNNLKTDALLRRVIEQYHSLFSIMSEGVIFYNGDGEIFAMNESAQKLLRKSFKELKGQCFKADYPCLKENGDPLPIEDYPSRIVLRDNKSVKNHIVGICFSEEEVVWFSVNARPLYYGKDKSRPDVVLSTFNDITEQRKMIRKLHESESRFRAIIEDQTELICRFLPDGTITFANKAYCEFFGKKHDDIIGERYFPVVYPEDVKTVKEEADAMTPEKPLRITENRVMRFDGKIRWTQWISRAFFDADGEKVEEQAVGRDITVQKQAEIQQQQLMQADKLISLGTLVSGIAHEINNPNNFIMLNAPFLSEYWKNIKPVLDDVMEKNGDFSVGNLRYSQSCDRVGVLFDDIVDGARRIERIVTELKNFSRPDNSEFRDKVDINRVVRSSITILNNKIKKSTNNFQVSLGSRIPHVYGSFQKLEQVVINVLQNACESLENKNSSIYISTSFNQAEGCVGVMIKDTGPGIEPDLIPRITDPFFTTKRSDGGTGLGLSICQQIVDLHHGSFGVDSTVGKGTVVMILLPVENEI